MGKRNSGKFAKRKDDAYFTPLDAAQILQPYLQLEGLQTFVELCAGAHDLVRHVESFGLECVLANDINGGRDALEITDFGEADCVLTNPPHTRKIMHALIMHFMRSGKPVWLLIDYDWSITQQSAPFLDYCTDIVPIGRVIWITGTDNGGYNNYAWYRFHIDHSEGPRLRKYGWAEEKLAAIAEQDVRLRKQAEHDAGHAVTILMDAAFAHRVSWVPNRDRHGPDHPDEIQRRNAEIDRDAYEAVKAVIEHSGNVSILRALLEEYKTPSVV
jgi:hypothetical protein